MPEVAEAIAAQKLTVSQFQVGAMAIGTTSAFAEARH